MRLSRFSLAVLALIAAAPARADDVAERRSITVSADGAVAATPDIVRISSGVTTEAANAKEALMRNSEVMAKIIAALKASGIDAKDIQTTSFRVEPRYTRPKEGEAPVIDGYRVVNQVEIVARRLDALGDVLDQLVSLGANELGGLTYEVSEGETLRDEARKLAVANALRRAQIYAEAAGAQVGDVLSIQEGGEEPRPAPVMRAMKAQGAPIERGTQMLEANVTVTWELR